MSRKPSTHRLDKNHKEVVELAQAHGWEVISLTSSGQGIPDLLCWKASHGFRLIEVKAGKYGRLTEAQKAFRLRYRLPITYIHSAEDASEVFR